MIYCLSSKNTTYRRTEDQYNHYFHSLLFYLCFPHGWQRSHWLIRHLHVIESEKGVAPFPEFTLRNIQFDTFFVLFLCVIKNLLGVKAANVLYKHRFPDIGRSCVVKILVLLNLSISGTNYRALTNRPAAFCISLSHTHTRARARACTHARTPVLILTLTELFEETVNEGLSKNWFSY